MARRFGHAHGARHDGVEHDSAEAGADVLRHRRLHQLRRRGEAPGDTLPAFREATMRTYRTALVTGVLAPAGTPPEIIAKLNREITDILKQKDVAEALGQMDAQPAGNATLPQAQKAAADVRETTPRLLSTAASVLKTMGPGRPEAVGHVRRGRDRRHHVAEPTDAGQGVPVHAPLGPRARRHPGALGEHDRRRGRLHPREPAALGQRL